MFKNGKGVRRLIKMVAALPLLQLGTCTPSEVVLTAIDQVYQTRLNLGINDLSHLYDAAFALQPLATWW